MDAAAIDRKKKKRRKNPTAYRLAKNGPSSGVKKIHSDGCSTAEIENMRLDELNRRSNLHTRKLI
jgi:hypothetical protein